MLLKTREDGTTKARMIVDLRRSGGKGYVDLPEMVVLPRLSDLIDGIVDLIAFDAIAPQETSGYEICFVDFEGAFHTLAIREEDRGAMAIRTLEGWAIFRRLCCGMAAAPFVWCRVGAAAARLGQVCFQPWELRTQLCADDPAIATRGTPAERAWFLGSLLLFWRVLGFTFNWRKAHRGQTVQWIGAQISVEKREGSFGVLATFAPKKFQELRANVDALHKAIGMVKLMLVQHVAGQLSWASGLFPWIRSFNVASAKRCPAQLFFVMCIKQAISWIRLLLAGLVRDPTGKQLVVQRWTGAVSRNAMLRVCIRSDSSPFGFGAILFVQGVPRSWLAQ